MAPSKACQICKKETVQNLKCDDSSSGVRRLFLWLQSTFIVIVSHECVSHAESKNRGILKFRQASDGTWNSQVCVKFVFQRINLWQIKFLFHFPESEHS